MWQGVKPTQSKYQSFCVSEHVKNVKKGLRKMKREQLKEMGLEKEQIDSIMKINGDDIENAKSAPAVKIRDLQTEVSELKEQIVDLQRANADAVTAHSDEMNQLKFDFAVEKALFRAKAKNIKAVISDALDITAEDLKYLRDLAEQETVNRYTVAEVSIDMSGMQNTVNGEGGFDGFVSDLTDAVNEAVDSITEGVHE